MRNFEIKVRINKLDEILNLIKKSGAVFDCKMHHVDRYFNVGSYKKKIREIDDKDIQLISYSRREKVGRKESEYDIKTLTTKEKSDFLDKHKIVCTVDKTRELWIYKHTRVHIDFVKGLGRFLELEIVMDDINTEEGVREFNTILKLLEINKKDSVACSYSDLILNNNKAFLMI